MLLITSNHELSKTLLCNHALNNTCKMPRLWRRSCLATFFVILLQHTIFPVPLGFLASTIVEQVDGQKFDASPYYQVNLDSQEFYTLMWLQDVCEEFLHTFRINACTHKTHQGMELLCNCSLTSKVVQCNIMKFIKILMCCVHLEDTKTWWKNHN